MENMPSKRAKENHHHVDDYTLHLVQGLLLENEPALKRFSVRQIYRLLSVSKLWREALSKFLKEGIPKPKPGMVIYYVYSDVEEEGEDEEEGDDGEEGDDEEAGGEEKQCPHNIHVEEEEGGEKQSPHDIHVQKEGGGENQLPHGTHVEEAEGEEKQSPHNINVEAEEGGEKQSPHDKHVEKERGGENQSPHGIHVEEEGGGEKQCSHNVNVSDAVDNNASELYSDYLEEEEQEEEQENWFVMVRYGQEECHSLSFSDKEGVLFRPPFHTIRYNDYDPFWTEHLGWSTWNLGRLTSSHGLMFAVVSSPLPKVSLTGLEYKLVVLNCFTGYFKVLLSKVSVHFHSIQVTFNKDNKSHYYVLLSDLHEAHSFPRTYVATGFSFWFYNSVEESCEQITRAMFHSRYNWEDDDLDCLYQSSFFFHRPVLRTDEWHHEFYGYCIAENKWSFVLLDMEAWEEELKDKSLSCFHFLAFTRCNDRIYTCVAIEKNYKKGLPNVYTEFKVCDLIPISPHEAMWVEVSSFCIPEPLPRTTEMKPKAFAEANEFFCCSFEYKWQYVRGENEHELRPPPAIYDMVHKRWHSLPSGVWPGGTDFKSFNCLFALRPWQAIRHVP